MGDIFLNGIKYAGGVSNIFDPIIYSEEERKIGVWTDGKPLYQKTVHINALPNASQIGQYVDYPHGIADIETICYYECITHYPTNVYGNTIKTPRVTFSTSGFNNQSSMDAYCNYTNIRIEVGQDRSNANADFTIWYTKTTDVAGSGSWTPSGVPAVHYSTNETVVGTWTNGKPLYERTIEFNCADTSNVQTAYSIPSNCFVRTVCDAYFENSANNLSQQFRYTWYKDHFWSYIVNNSGHAISVHRETTDGNWQSGVKFVAIIRYTKTTD